MSLSAWKGGEDDLEYLSNFDLYALRRNVKVRGFITLEFFPF